MPAAAAFAALRPASAPALGRPTAFSLDLTGRLGAGGGAARTAGGWQTLPAVRAPYRFDVLGLAWSRGARVQAQVRTRRRGDAWSAWTALHAAGDHAPDGAPAIAGTEPCWTGTADKLQVRLRGVPHRLRANFVRARPTALAARRLARRARARVSRRGPSAGAAQLPAIIPRSAWGGDAFPPKQEVLYGTVVCGFVHHTVTANEYGPEDSAAIVLGICRYHRDHNGWNDIGYNFLVDRYGQVFEGRAGGVDQPVVGAQAQGYNSVSTGAACLGDFTAESFTEQGLEALARLLAWKLPLHAAPVEGPITVISQGGEANRYRAGTPVTLERISGHRDGNTTECPGDTLYATLPTLRTRVAALAVPAWRRR